MIYSFAAESTRNRLPISKIPEEESIVIFLFAYTSPRKPDPPKFRNPPGYEELIASVEFLIINPPPKIRLAAVD